MADTPNVNRPTTSHNAQRITALEMAVNNQLKALQFSIDKLTEAVNNSSRSQEVHNAQQKALEDMVQKHERVLFGQNGDGGLVRDNNENVKSLRSLEKAVWAIITPLLSGIGLGVIWLIYQTVGR